jgi:hypothetical protein
MSTAGSVPATHVVAPGHPSTPAPTRPADGYDYDRDDPTFLALLRASRPAVKRVGRWLAECGYRGIIHATRERPSPKVMRLFRDPGDITIILPSAARLRVEVKRRFFSFAGETDYRLRYPTMVQIAQCNKIDDVWPPPFLYIITSHDLCAGIYIDVGATRAHWLRVPRYQANAHRVRDIYDCPIEHVRFFRFDEP